MKRQEHFWKGIEVLSSFPGFLLPMLVFGYFVGERYVFFALCIGLAALVIFHICIKSLFPTPRPDGYQATTFSPHKSLHASFPSNHAAGSFLLYFFALQRLPYYSLIFLVFAIAVSLSRLHLTKHYPIDILGSILSSYIIFRIILLFV